MIYTGLESNLSAVAQMRELQAENARLRAALEIVARGDDGMDSHTALGMQHIARKALGHSDDRTATATPAAVA